MSDSWDHMDCSPPGSSVHGVLQATILEWVAISFSRGSSQPRNRAHVSCGFCIAGRLFTLEPLRRPTSALKDATILMLKLFSSPPGLLAAILASISVLLLIPANHTVAQTVKNVPVIQGTWVQPLGQEDPLEKGMATHSSILACRIPWTKGPWATVHGVAESQTRLSDEHFPNTCARLWCHLGAWWFRPDILTSLHSATWHLVRPWGSVFASPCLRFKGRQGRACGNGVDDVC